VAPPPPGAPRRTHPSPLPPAVRSGGCSFARHAATAPRCILGQLFPGSAVLTAQGFVPALSAERFPLPAASWPVCPAVGVVGWDHGC